MRTRNDDSSDDFDHRRCHRNGGAEPPERGWTTGAAAGNSGSVSVPAHDIGDAIIRETGSSDTGERLEIHNVSVDEQVAQADLCGQVHLPTGRICVEHAGHSCSCRFEAPQRAQEAAQRELRNA